jgi:hypothetical protein
MHSILLGEVIFTLTRTQNPVSQEDLLKEINGFFLKKSCR